MSYNTFAWFYDNLTENVDYKVRSEYISNFFSNNDKPVKKVLDLACGTGSMVKIFEEQGYMVTGVDLSPDMLTVAASKCSNSNFLCADITDFKSNEKFDACICLLDSINHLKSFEDVIKCFNNVYNLLNDDGLFIFYVNTVYKHKNILADSTFVLDEEEYFLSWDNEYLGDNTVRIFLDFFVFNGISYDRYSEQFDEKAYEIDELIAALASFKIIGIYDDLSLNPPNSESERIFFVCRKGK